jgi:predicted nucleic acid-binding Zn ribbon protein
MIHTPKRRRPNDKRGLTPIGDILKELFPVEAMPKGMNEELRVLGAWATSVGPEIAKNASPKTLRNGILFVETRHPVWASELQTKSHLIRKKINETLGADFVREIQFRVARI